MVIQQFTVIQSDMISPFHKSLILSREISHLIFRLCYSYYRARWLDDGNLGHTVYRCVIRAIFFIHHVPLHTALFFHIYFLQIFRIYDQYVYLWRSWDCRLFQKHNEYFILHVFQIKNWVKYESSWKCCQSKRNRSFYYQMDSDKAASTKRTSNATRVSNLLSHMPLCIPMISGMCVQGMWNAQVKGQVTETHRLKVNSHCDTALFISMYDITMVEP